MSKCSSDEEVDRLPEEEVFDHEILGVAGGQLTTVYEYLLSSFEGTTSS